MNYHIVSTSNAGYGAIFTNKTEAKAYRNMTMELWIDHPTIDRLVTNLALMMWGRITVKGMFTSR